MSETPSRVLQTTGGKITLHDYRLSQGGRGWAIGHAGTVLTAADEVSTIVKKTNHIPYGISLWPAGIALAHEIADRAGDFNGRSVLELGAGTGLPGIVAAALGARVVQMDRDEVSLHLCRLNGERNGVDIEYRRADWTDWEEARRFDWIIGADILYVDEFHPPLRRIFEGNSSGRGRILVSDPFRTPSVKFLEILEGDGWGVTCSKWDVGEDTSPVGVFELVPPNDEGPAPGEPEG